MKNQLHAVAASLITMLPQICAVATQRAIPDEAGSQTAGNTPRSARLSLATTWLAITLTAVCMLAARLCFAAGLRPNILLILTDDQRFDTIGALGNPEIKTPNLDRLARQGFIFRNAYNFGGNTAAVCIPARNQLATGKTFFHLDAGAFDTGKGPTQPKAMKAAGYETYYREKSGTANLHFIRKQFDHFKDIHQVNALASGYAARGIVDDAIQFITNERDKTEPFFMYLGFPCPHDPRWAAKEFRDLYDPAKLSLPPNYLPVHPYDIGDMTGRDECLEAWPRTEAAIRRHLHDYYSLTTGMDQDIGRLLDTIQQQSLAENTIIIFTSDQGIALGSHGLMGKQNIYDDTQRVPLIVSGPGIPKGESSALVYLHDLLPTFCDLIGAKQPAGIDGRSLAPIINGKTDKVRDALMLAYTDTQRSVRDERWKLICYPQINRTMLFDLKNDSRETNDLAGDARYASEMARLKQLLKEEQKRAGDKLPLTSANPKPAEFKAPDKKLPTPWPSGGLAPGHPVQDEQTGKRLTASAATNEVVSAEEMRNTKPSLFKIVYPPQSESAHRLEWFQDAKFGMFIHWGIYSPRGGIAPDGKPQQHGYTEWYQKANHLSHAEYAKLAAEFNPQKFDANRWAQIAKQAGMRYLTFTAKHHDGFALFDSKVSSYDVMDATPFKRDVVEELRAACDQQGLKLCLYYSHCQDWEEWNAWQTSDWIYPEKTGTPVDHELYLTGKALPQIEELCTKYHPDGLWFDTPWFNAQKLDRAVSKGISDTVRKFALNALINSRIAHGSDNDILHADLFDYLTLGDQEIPSASLPLYAESPDSITTSYGYDARPGVKYRPAPELLRRMIRTVAGGGNYLLNVGPNGDGEIPQQAVAELGRIGEWMKTNGDAIYGTTPHPLGARPTWDDATAKNGKLYLFPITHKGGVLTVKGLKTVPKNLTRLGSAEEIAFATTPDGIQFDFPADIPGEPPMVLVLE